MPWFLGIDSGSITTKAAIVDKDGHLQTWFLVPTAGKPLEGAIAVIFKVLGCLSPGSQIEAICVTGSGRKLLEQDLLMHFPEKSFNKLHPIQIKNEITCQTLAAVNYLPQVTTVLEMGGQDSKIIMVEKGLPIDFAMNSICAAGTGSFLDHQATRLGIDMQTFDNLSNSSRNPCPIDARCTVFAESAMVSAQQSGVSLPDILNGLVLALAQIFIRTVGAGKNLKGPYLFQGGVAQNRTMISALSTELGEEIIVYPRPQISGAVGAALYAASCKPQ